MASLGAGHALLDDHDGDEQAEDASSACFEFSEDASSTSDLKRSTRTRSLLARLLMVVRRRRASANGHVSAQELDGWRKHAQRSPRAHRKTTAKICSCILFGTVFFFGLLHLVNFGLGYYNLFEDDATGRFHAKTAIFNEKGEVDLDDLTRDVVPIHCHSHNDYWRQTPLYDALRWGCTGVEADVWLRDDDLLVGHRPLSLKREHTFRSMYVDPLLRMLDHRNAGINSSANVPRTTTGVFESDPEQTLVLLVDFKTDGHELLPIVAEQLTPLREKGYLSFFNGTDTNFGPITVVATGNAPFDALITNATQRDIFFDAPLDRMYEEPSQTTSTGPFSKLPGMKASSWRRASGQGTVGTDEDSHFDTTNSYYASVDFKRAIGWLWLGQITERQLDLIRGQIQGARSRGLKARYWGTPSWPIGLRNKVWQVLIDEGVDYLNGDDLRGMTSLDWSRKKHHGLFD